MHIVIRKIGIAISDPTRSLAASKLVSYVSSQPVQPAGVGMLGKHRQRPLPLLVIPGLLPDESGCWRTEGGFTEGGFSRGAHDRASPNFMGLSSLGFEEWVFFSWLALSRYCSSAAKLSAQG